MNKRWQFVAARFALLYGAAAALWILGSDLLTGWVVKSTGAYETLSMFKGFGFVLLTTLLLFVTLRRLLLTEFEARTQAEETTHRLRELEVIAEHGAELFYRRDLQNRFTYVSRHYQTLLGYRPEDLTRAWTGILTDHPLNRIALERTAEAIRTGLRQPPYRIEVRKKDGRPILLEIHESPLKDNNGEVIAMVGAARDVTERERVAEALRESEERYRTVFAAATDGILLLSEGRFIDCNQRAIELFGCTRAELLGRRPGDLSPERQPDGTLSAEQELMRSECALAGEPQFFQWQHRRLDGTTFMAEVSLRRCAVRSSTLLLVLVRDVTERIRTDEALRASEEKWRALYTSMNEGLALHEVVYDPAGAAVDYRILDVNPAFETITGLARSSVLGKLASEIYGPGTPPYLDVYAPVAASGRPTMFETFFPPIGKHFAISVFSPARGQFATVFADVTKRKDAETQISLLSQVYALTSNISQAIVRIADRENALPGGLSHRR
jgi:PAS domain S-box-containing protein